jgi:hypothetical protein
MKTYAIAPEKDVEKYLTPGKEYPVVEDGFSKSHFGFSRQFTIVNDLGEFSICLTEFCAHIGYQNWTLIHKEE